MDFLLHIFLPGRGQLSTVIATTLSSTLKGSDPEGSLSKGTWQSRYSSTSVNLPNIRLDVHQNILDVGILTSQAVLDIMPDFVRLFDRHL